MVQKKVTIRKVPPYGKVATFETAESVLVFDGRDISTLKGQWGKWFLNFPSIGTFEIEGGIAKTPLGDWEVERREETPPMAEPARDEQMREALIEPPPPTTPIEQGEPEPMSPAAPPETAEEWGAQIANATVPEGMPDQGQAIGEASLAEYASTYLNPHGWTVTQAAKAGWFGVTAAGERASWPKGEGWQPLLMFVRSSIEDENSGEADE